MLILLPFIVFFIEGIKHFGESVSEIYYGLKTWDLK